MWIIAINGEEPITDQGVIDELNCHKNTREKYKVNISLCRSRSYQSIYHEDINSRFDQVRPVVSNLEVCLPENPPTPENIGEVLNIPQRQFRKEYLFVKYYKNKNVRLILSPILIKSLPEGKKFLRSLIDISIKEGDFLYACKFVTRHCKNGSSPIQCIDFDKS